MLGITSLTSFAALIFFVQICGCSKAAITITDTQMFSDISYYNFGEDVYDTKTQEFAITARTGKRVSLYWLSSDQGDITLTVFDGINSSFPVIQTEPYKPASDKMLIVPMNITSSGQNMFVRITFVSNLRFDALVTDYMQQVDCRPPVLVLNYEGLSTANYKFEQNNQSECYYVVHAIQHYQQISQNIVSLNRHLDRIHLYKGLKMDLQHLLQTSNQMNEVSIYDYWVVIHPKTTVSLELGYQLHKGNRTLPVLFETQNTIMSSDYLTNTPGSNEEIIVLDLVPPVTSVQLTFLNLLGKSSVTVTTFTLKFPVIKPVTYLASNFKGEFNVIYKCNQVRLAYSVTDKTSNVTNGFYGMYTDVTSYKNRTHTLPPTTPVVPNTTKGSSLIFSIGLTLASVLLSFL